MGEKREQKPTFFPPQWEVGAQLFEAGEWWEAHEAWEVEWHLAVGERRLALQALILLAAALHKRWRMGSLSHRNFYKAQVYLGRVAPQAFGTDWVDLEKQVWATLNSEELGHLPLISRRSSPPEQSGPIQ